MLAYRFCFSLVTSIFLPLSRSHNLSPVENELRDLVTQRSVIMRTGMTSVIRSFRDGTIATVDWPSLLETASELDRASEELGLCIYMLDVHSRHNNLEVRLIAQSEATQNALTAKRYIDSARDNVHSWLVGKE